MSLFLLLAAAIVGPVLPTQSRASDDETAPPGVLFAGENWTGRYVNLRAPIADLGEFGFAGRAESLQGAGLWQLCDKPNFEGECVTLRGDQKELGAMARKVVSVRKVGN